MSPLVSAFRENVETMAAKQSVICETVRVCRTIGASNRFLYSYDDNRDICWRNAHDVTRGSFSDQAPTRRPLFTPSIGPDRWMEDFSVEEETPLSKLRTRHIMHPLIMDPF